MHKDLTKHCSIQPPCICIAQGRMIAGQQMGSVRERIVCSMNKSELRFAGDDAALQQIRQVAVKCDPAETNDHTNSPKRFNLLSKMIGTTADLHRSGLVPGRSAAHDRGNPRVTKLQAVIARGPLGLIGKTNIVQHRVHEVSRSVAGERAASSIRSVSPGSQPKNQNTGTRIAKSRNRPRPINLVLISATLGFGNVLAILS